ncbi:hypothetical protein AS189_00535 [Arthrobacter alpinus]|uniref:Uncharacterized protein n=1 Tax=Arthrobacter alpinus TaxID=656366 RepID=A0A0S2LUV5_9MICC|nr:hypothetical protein [Arthrobacter alpinus]ALO65247.1 hypothetical protein AS189_00535 [Arthrobacter alpinus]
MNAPASTSARKDGVVYLTLEGDSGTLAVAPEDADPNETYLHELFIGREGSIERIDHGPLVSPYGDLSHVTLSSLSDALKFNRCCQGSPERIYVEKSDGPINHDLLNLDDVHLEVDDSQVSAIVTQLHPSQPELSEAEYAESLGGVMERYGCRVAGVRYLTSDGTTFDGLGFDYSGLGLDPEVEAREAAENAEIIRNMVHNVEVSLITDTDARATKLIDAGRALAAYLEAQKGGSLTAGTIVDLLRGGHTKLLLGHKESAFLDVKSQKYNVGVSGQPGDQQKIELAQDVARFANGNQDAVLVLGYEEGKSGQDTVIKCIKEIKLEGFDPATYLNILDARVVPAVTGLTVDSVETSPGKGIIYIFVPAQPPEMQPYLVHGVVAEGKVEGAFFSIVQRRGEGSITITASQIHGYLVAGKAFLQGK